ncbi:unnamed protein product, partial [Effrenium voratum]
IWCFTTDDDVEWEFCDILPLWTLKSGPCTTDIFCIYSNAASTIDQLSSLIRAGPSFPNAYSNRETCELSALQRGVGGFLRVGRFDT